jgi:hypothetical protein
VLPASVQQKRKPLPVFFRVKGKIRFNGEQFTQKTHQCIDIRMVGISYGYGLLRHI